jgi:hypothetical protein
MNTLTITLPRSVLRHEDLVVIPRKELNALMERATARPRASEPLGVAWAHPSRAAHAVREKDVLRWLREARALKRVGKLPVLQSLRSL